MSESIPAPAPDPAWLAANQALLTALFGGLHRRLAAVLSGEAPPTPAEDIAPLTAAMPAPAAIDRLTALFGLDPFARELVLLCTAVELDGRIAQQVATLDGPGGRTLPTVATAFRALPDAHWSAFSPSHPLRRYRLIEMEGDGRFTARSLRLDERVLHFLLGAPAIDSRLEPLLRPLPAAAGSRGARAALAQRAAAALSAGGVVLLTGRDPAALEEAAAEAATKAGRTAVRLELADLPATPAERELLTRLLAREMRLGGAVPAIAAYEAEESATRALPGLLDRLEEPAIVLARGPLPLGARAALRVEVPAPTAAERATAWTVALPSRAGDPAAVEAVAAHFDLTAPAIRAAAREAAARPRRTPLRQALWAAARTASRHRLDDLAERIETRAGWDDLILPEARMATLREIVAQVQHRLRVYDGWGFRDRLSARSLGVTALFSGASGTGKTLAAEVVANTLALDLYRIDLSAVVSKYIGETEKNLRRIFDAAEAGGAVLLFDEADALFGKRSEVKDSHDRYANIEVSYLLQRMESYAGLAVLTTNMKQNLDQAFLRRIRFILDFPFPGPAERASIWARIFPDGVPRENLDPQRLAQLNLPGGAIRNIALNAAFLAAADGGVVRPAHVLAAARGEYAKLDKPLTEGELRGWAGPLR